MQGDTGIFGKNAKGKSAIVGSLMYGLFNTTDRGSISNIHIVNNRKKNCMASIDIVVNGDSFRIKRDTIKHNTRKGETYASTGLSIPVDRSFLARAGVTAMMPSAQRN